MASQLNEGRSGTTAVEKEDGGSDENGNRKDREESGEDIAVADNEGRLFESTYKIFSSCDVNGSFSAN